MVSTSRSKKSQEPPLYMSTDMEVSWISIRCEVITSPEANGTPNTPVRSNISKNAATLGFIANIFARRASGLQQSFKELELATDLDLITWSSYCMCFALIRDTEILGGDEDTYHLFKAVENEAYQAKSLTARETGRQSTTSRVFAREEAITSAQIIYYFYWAVEELSRERAAYLGMLVKRFKLDSPTSPASEPSHTGRRKYLQQVVYKPLGFEQQRYATKKCIRRTGLMYTHAHHVVWDPSKEKKKLTFFYINDDNTAK